MFKSIVLGERTAHQNVADLSFIEPENYPMLNDFEEADRKGNELQGSEQQCNVQGVLNTEANQTEIISEETEEQPKSKTANTNNDVTKEIDRESEDAKVSEEDSESEKEWVSEDVPRRSRKKKRHVDENEWDSRIQKIKRCKGEKYKGLIKKDGKWMFGKNRAARQLKPKCNCAQSKRNTKLHCNLLTEKDREIIFKNFWSKSWMEKKEFVKNLISIETIKQRKTASQVSRRKQTLYFFLSTPRGNKIRVCKKQFLNTLCLGEWSVLNWTKSNIMFDDDESEQVSINSQINSTSDVEVKMPDDPDINPTPKLIKKTVRVAKRNHKKDLENEYLVRFLTNLPSLESHYCRSTTRKKYLEPIWKTKSQLYRFYKQECTKDGIACLSEASFSHVFSDMNYGLFRPKKDQCDICLGFENKNIDELLYAQHLKKKTAAREEKARDKECKVWVFTMDLQSVLMAPLTNASAMYYKSKLVVHNFTMFNLKNQDGHCWLWHEGQGGLTANEFASILHKFVSELDVKEGDEVVIYSDGCTYQNRNVVMSNMFLSCSVTKKITIVQKYLEKGHTQMECDSMHSVIERKIRNTEIYTPAGYAALCKSARLKPKPYTVTYLTHEFFKQFSCLSFYNSIRPGYKKGDPQVIDIRCLKYNPSGVIEYKIDYADEWTVMPKRTKKSISSSQTELPHLYKEPIKIDKKKFENLQALKSVIPQDYHNFYDQLPHKDS